jgi:hypothetical protein
MTNKSALKLLSYWTTMLGLADWGIELHVTQGKFPPTADHEERHGIIQYDIRRRTAEVWVLDNEEFESTLVHELLHLKLWFVNGETELENVLEERLVDDLTSALLAREEE